MKNWLPFVISKQPLVFLRDVKISRHGLTFCQNCTSLQHPPIENCLVQEPFIRVWFCQAICTYHFVKITEHFKCNFCLIQPEILYWCDSNYPDESKLEQYDLRTNQRSTLASLPSPSQPYGVTVHGNYVYWSDWVKNAVYRVDRFATDPLAEAGRGRAPARYAGNRQFAGLWNW